MQKRPLLVLAALAAASEPDFGRETIERWKNGIREKHAEDPIGSTLGTVLVSSLLFYKAEKGHNPKVKTFYDALVYVTTNLSVGYCDIFAVTTEGKAIASALMTFGPAMAARLLDEPKKKDEPSPESRAVVDRLDKILAVLEARQQA